MVQSIFKSKNKAKQQQKNKAKQKKTHRYIIKKELEKYLI